MKTWRCNTETDGIHYWVTAGWGEHPITVEPTGVRVARPANDEDAWWVEAETIDDLLAKGRTKVNSMGFDVISAQYANPDNPHTACVSITVANLTEPDTDAIYAANPGTHRVDLSQAIMH